jgi:hypothetical protein
MIKKNIIDYTVTCPDCNKVLDYTDDSRVSQFFVCFCGHIWGKRGLMK